MSAATMQDIQYSLLFPSLQKLGKPLQALTFFHIFVLFVIVIDQKRQIETFLIQIKTASAMF